MLSRRHFTLLLAGQTAAAMAEQAPIVPKTGTPARLDALVADEVRAGRFSGTALVRRGSEILLEQSYGYAVREWNIPTRPDTRFRVGSLTKQFTAAAVLRLVERGQLSLDAPVDRCWPQCPANMAHVTLHQLLSHTAGIPNLQAQPDYDAMSRLPTTAEATARRFGALKLDFEPGSDFRYSNTGYIILGLILERVGGNSLETVFRTELLDPLRLRDTGVDKEGLLLDRRAVGYQRRDGVVGPADHIDISVPGAAGCLYATTADLARWTSALFGGQIIGKKMVAAMTAQDPMRRYGRMPDGKTTRRYGYGLLAARSKAGPLFYHSGSINGFRAYLRHWPEIFLTIALETNLAEAALRDLSLQLAAAALDRSLEDVDPLN